MSDPAQTVTPCYFCGGKMEAVGGSTCYYACQECGATGPHSDTYALALSRWNALEKPLLPSPSEREALAHVIGDAIDFDMGAHHMSLNDDGEPACGACLKVADALLAKGYSKRSSPSSSEAASDDTRRLNLVADLLDDVRFQHDQYGEPIVVLVWNAGDGGGDVKTIGKDWREAIDKMLLRLYGDVPKTASPSIGCPRCGKQGTSDELLGHTCKASPSSAGQEVREAVRRALTKLAVEQGQKPASAWDTLDFRDREYPALSAGETPK